MMPNLTVSRALFAQLALGAALLPSLFGCLGTKPDSPQSEDLSPDDYPPPETFLGDVAKDQVVVLGHLLTLAPCPISSPPPPPELFGDGASWVNTFMLTVEVEESFGPEVPEPESRVIVTETHLASNDFSPGMTGILYGQRLGYYATQGGFLEENPEFQDAGELPLGWDAHVEFECDVDPMKTLVLSGSDFFGAPRWYSIEDAVAIHSSVTPNDTLSAAPLSSFVNISSCGELDAGCVENEY